MNSRREIYPDELNFFYQKTGEAIWHLQYVEDFLAKIIVIKAVVKKPGGISEEDAEKKLKELQKKTLGQLIHKIESESIVTDTLLESLKSFNNERKWIVHNSNRDKESLYTDNGRRYFLERIERFTDLATSIQQQIVNELIAFGNEQGISEADVFEMAQNELNKLKGLV